MKQNNLQNYQEMYKKTAEGFIQSGGRFEMLGNHTDHNHGKTLASTCSLMIEGAFSKEDNNIVKFYSKGNCEFEISLVDTSYREDELGSSQCFVRGVADYLIKHNYRIGGFSAYIESSVPPGSGVSSSAAFEILIGKIFNKLYNENKISLLDICKAGQYAENNYFGKQSGLLDQIACGSLGTSYIDFENIENPKIEILHVDFSSYQFVIVDTGKSHAELSDLCSSISGDMWSAAKKMGHKYLRECSLELLEANKNQLTESEWSSRNLLKNAMVNDEYEGSLAEAIDISNKAMDNLGASKINGGGFGGSIICVVPKTKLDHYLKVMKEKYGEAHVFSVSVLNEVEQ